MARKQVAFLSAYLTDYTQPFFTALHGKCQQAGIDLKIIYGNPPENDEVWTDRTDFSLGHYVSNRFIVFGKYTAVWQPVLSLLRDADLIIVPQESKLLLNYVLLAQQLLGKKKVAFGGHGRNLQARNHNTIIERSKKWISMLPHWWFVYTPRIAEYLVLLGFPEDRITVFYNTIDTTRVLQWRSEISTAEISELREKLNLKYDNICIYIGRMYPEKRLEFLIEACRRIRTLVPDFSMLFVGSGSDAPIVKRFCEEQPWASYLGPLFGREKVKVCMLANLLLMPGLVGLAIVDAFAMRMPIVTTDFRFHSPEIEYLENGHNGVMVAPATDIDRYASTVAELLTDRERLARMKNNCEQSASYLTIENMANHFLDGILRALAVG